MLIGLMLFSASSSGTVSQGAKDVVMPGVHEIQVTLKKYEFNPGTLRVRRGERVRLVLDAADHDHGFKLNEFDVNQKVQKGTTATVEFIADKAGFFNFAVRVSVVGPSRHEGNAGGGRVSQNSVLAAVATVLPFLPTTLSTVPSPPASLQHGF
jgi:cytochrome c oxidase subunit 2